MDRIRPQEPVNYSGLALIGESPGRQEIEQGFPFVGKSGVLLNTVLESVGIDRTRCLVTNVFLSRPDNDKIDLFFRPRYVDGELLESDTNFADRYGLYRNRVVCDEHRHDMERLDVELKQYRPNIILTLGATALWRIIGINGITAARGKWTLPRLGDQLVGVMSTWHPSAVLRDRNKKLPEFVSDIKSVKDVLDGLLAPKTG
jgi:DNA polymerase